MLAHLLEKSRVVLRPFGMADAQCTEHYARGERALHEAQMLLVQLPLERERPQHLEPDPGEEEHGKHVEHAGNREQGTAAHVSTARQRGCSQATEDQPVIAKKRAQDVVATVGEQRKEHQRDERRPPPTDRAAQRIEREQDAERVEQRRPDQILVREIERVRE